LLIPSVRGKKTEAYFGMNNRDITGKTIVFKGKYKYQQANNAKVSFAIKLDTHLQRIDEGRYRATAHTNTARPSGSPAPGRQLKTFVWKCRLHVPRNFSFEYSVMGRPGFG